MRKSKRKNCKSKGSPGFFSDFGKKAKDLLMNGYCTDHKLSISTYSGSGVTLTSTAAKQGRVSRGGVAAQYKNATVDVKVDKKSNISTSLAFTFCKKFSPSMKTMASFKLPDYYSSKTLTSTAAKQGRFSIGVTAQYKNATVDVKVDKKSNIPTSLAFTFCKKFSPSMKTMASFKLPDYYSSKLSVQYLNEHATLAMSVVLNRSPAVELSATIGTPSIAFGMEAKYKTTATYNAGINVIKPHCNASIILANNGDSLRASYMHYLDQPKKNAAVVEITRRFSKNENTYTVGGSYTIDHLTMVKASFNNHGNLKTLVQHNIKPKSSLAISGEFDVKDFNKIPRIGLALALKL